MNATICLCVLFSIFPPERRRDGPEKAALERIAKDRAMTEFSLVVARAKFERAAEDSRRYSMEWRAMLAVQRSETDPEFDDVNAKKERMEEAMKKEDKLLYRVRLLEARMVEANVAYERAKSAYRVAIHAEEDHSGVDSDSE